MIEENIAFIANYYWKKSIDNINETLSDGQAGSFNMNDYYYLTVIYQLGEPNFSDVAKALHLTKPSISAMVRRLSRNGLVKKTQSDEDKRVFYLSLTEKGLKIVEGDYALYHDMAKNIESMFTEKQISDINCMLDMLVGKIKSNKDGRKLSGGKK